MTEFHDNKPKRITMTISRRRMVIAMLTAVVAGMLLTLALVSARLPSVASPQLQETDTISIPTFAWTSARQGQGQINSDGTLFSSLTWVGPQAMFSLFQYSPMEGDLNFRDSEPVSSLEELSVIRSMSYAPAVNQALVTRQNRDGNVTTTLYAGDLKTVIAQWDKSVTAAFSPDGTVFTVAFPDTIETYLTQGAAFLSRIHLNKDYGSQFQQVAFTPDNQYVVAYTGVQVAFFIPAFNTVLHGDDAIYLAPQTAFDIADLSHLAFSSDGLVIAAGKDRIEVHSINQYPTQVTTVPLPPSTAVNSLALSADGRWIAYVSDSSVNLIDLDDANPKPETLLTTMSNPAALGFVSDTYQLIVASVSGFVEIWQTDSQVMITTWG